ncbi:MAG: hypothetical protein JXK16_03660 [Thiotrichales bacterium]|nr:hypothetical protein [Thiotrichales bacterium]
MTSLQSILLNRSLVGWVSVFLLALVAWLVGQNASLFLQNPVAPPLPVLSVQSSSVKPIQGTPSYLMGKPDAKALQTSLEASEPVSEMTDTRLKLTLKGVIDVDGAGVAIIQSSGQTLVVGEGEEIVKGVDLIEVYADQVVISHRGKRERLMMEELTKGLIESASNGVTTSAVASELNEKEAAALKEIGETLRKSPISISKYVRFKPIGKNGNWTAVKVWPKSNPELFNAIGFISGDLVKAVNGRSIQEMAQEPGLWQTFLNESQFELTVDRQGSSVTLSVNLN